MTYVVTDNCQKCKFTDCVVVCPVDCFYEIEEMLVIDPDECIDCGACEPECPVEAIYADDELPEEKMTWLKFNEVEAARIIDAGEDPIIEQKEPYPGAEERKADLGF